jgi:AraC-like DNA-binding protein
MSKLKSGTSVLRFALGYLLMIGVIFAGFSFYTYYTYSAAMRKEVVESGLNRLNRLCYQHERYLNAIVNTAEQMSLSPYIKPFAFSEHPEKAYELMRQIAPYTVTNDFCDQFFLFFRDDEYLYSSVSSIQLSMFLTSIVRLEQVTPDALYALLTTCNRVTVLPCQQVESPLLDGGESRMVTVLIPLGEHYQNAIGTLMFMIKDATYQSLLKDAIEDEANTYILYSGGVLAHSGPLTLPEETVEAAAESGSTAEITVGGVRYLLLSVKGESQGMRYVSVLPMSRVELSVRSGLSQFAIVVLLLLALCLPLVYALTRKNYGPILELRDSLVSKGNKTSDPIGDIQAGVQTLIGQNVALSTSLDDSLPMRKSTFVMDFMKGRYTTREQAVRAAEAVGLSIDRPLTAVVLSGATDKLVRPMDVGESPLGESGLVTGQGIDLIAYDQHLYLLFFDDGQALDAFARTLLTDGKAVARQAAVAVSNAHSQFQAASTAYLEAAAAYDNRLVMGDERVLRFSDITVDVADILPRARCYSDMISQALRSGNPAQLDQKITDLMLFLKRTSMSLFAFRMIYNDIIDTVLGSVSGEIALGTLNIYNVFTLSSCHSINDLDNLLRTLCHGILAKTPIEPDDEQNAIRQVVEYINDHFTDPDLSMTWLADRYGLSTAKLSMSFKELTQISPSDYLLMLRMEKAKELLAQTDETIKDVSAAVGYYDSSGFIRRFKQYASITPLQYRHSLKEGEK